MAICTPLVRNLPSCAYFQIHTKALKLLPHWLIKNQNTSPTSLISMELLIRAKGIGPFARTRERNFPLTIPQIVPLFPLLV